MELLKGEAIGRKLKSVIRSAKTLQENIHLLLCSALDHCRAHGDPIYLNRVMHELPDGQRKAAMAAWCREFGPLNVNGDFKVTVIPTEKREERKAPDWNVEGAIKTPYYVLNKKDKDFTPMDLTKVIKSLESRRTRDENHGVKHTKDEVRALKKFVEDWYNQAPKEEKAA